jgi:hypothetical protein
MDMHIPMYEERKNERKKYVNKRTKERNRNKKERRERGNLI